MIPPEDRIHSDPYLHLALDMFNSLSHHELRTLHELISVELVSQCRRIIIQSGDVGEVLGDDLPFGRVQESVVNEIPAELSNEFGSAEQIIDCRRVSSSIRAQFGAIDSCLFDSLVEVRMVVAQLQRLRGVKVDL